MMRIYLLALLFSLSACKLEPIDEQNKLKTGGTSGGTILPPDPEPNPEVLTKATWVSARLYGNWFQESDLSFYGKGSFIFLQSENLPALYTARGKFTFKNKEDFDFILNFEDQIKSEEGYSIYLELKLIKKGYNSICSENPTYICLPVEVPDVYEISNIQL